MQRRVLIGWNLQHGIVVIPEGRCEAHENDILPQARATRPPPLPQRFPPPPPPSREHLRAVGSSHAHYCPQHRGFALSLIWLLRHAAAVTPNTCEMTRLVLPADSSLHMPDDRCLLKPYLISILIDFRDWQWGSEYYSICAHVYLPETKTGLRDVQAGLCWYPFSPGL